MMNTHFIIAVLWLIWAVISGVREMKKAGSLGWGWAVAIICANIWVATA